jgi:acetyltransferase-like isoleucine patch superfamily enzyme
VITSGVTIGERCVIGANSVVTTDLPPFSIAAGTPARVLRTITYAEAEGVEGSTW